MPGARFSKSDATTTTVARRRRQGSRCSVRESARRGRTARLLGLAEVVRAEQFLQTDNLGAARGRLRDAASALSEIVVAARVRTSSAPARHEISQAARASTSATNISSVSEAVRLSPSPRRELIAPSTVPHDGGLLEECERALSRGLSATTSSRRWITSAEGIARTRASIAASACSDSVANQCKQKLHGFLLPAKRDGGEQD